MHENRWVVLAIVLSMLLPLNLSGFNIAQPALMRKPYLFKTVVDEDTHL